jgi:midasin (ATPase involved in ribosome maturation)
MKTTAEHLKIGAITLPFNDIILPSRESRARRMRECDERFMECLDEEDMQATYTVMAACLEELLSSDFVQRFGVYIGCTRWWTDWLKRSSECFEKEGYIDMEHHVLCGGVALCAPLRHAEARRRMCAFVYTCFRGMKIAFDVTQQGFEAKVFALLDEANVVPDHGYALTASVLHTLQVLARAIRVQLPVLLTGPTGCGKSAVIQLLAELCRSELSQAYITPEMETCTLVGSQAPSRAPDAEPRARIAWQDGIATHALKNDHWLLLDNLGDADACVLERLNPLLEEKVDWRLTENGEENPLQVGKCFRVFAAMSVPGAREAQDLSPALYNRFNIVNMPSLANQGDSLIDELKHTAAIVLALDREEPAVDLLGRGCLFIWSRLAEESSEGPRINGSVSFRTLVRILDSTYRLKLGRDTLTLVEAFVQAFKLILAGQFEAEDAATAFTSELQESLRMFDESVSSDNVEDIDLSPSICDGSIVMTEKRKMYAMRISAAILCKLPCLLEGPAGSGKTLMIKALARNWRDNGREAAVKVERVNNSRTTTMQDYFGSFIPEGSRFVFNKGALYRAMENGHWFLAGMYNSSDV